jgi:hypothetical protein
LFFSTTRGASVFENQEEIGGFDHHTRRTSTEPAAGNNRRSGSTQHLAMPAQQAGSCATKKHKLRIDDLLIPLAAVPAKALCCGKKRELLPFVAQIKHQMRNPVNVWGQCRPVDRAMIPVPF